MSLYWDIAKSHLLARRRQTIVSLSGVLLGVGFFLAVSAMMRGSEADFIARLIDNSPHITVSDEFRTSPPQPASRFFEGAAVEVRSVKPKAEVRGIRQYKRRLAEIASIPGVRVAPILSAQGIITFAGRDVGVGLTGVVPNLMRDVSAISTYMRIGKLEDLDTNPDGILIGDALAKKYRISMGDNLTIASPTGQVKTVKVVGMFHTGNQAVDEGQTYAALKKVQALMDRPNTANRFIIKLDDAWRARAVAATIEAQIGYKSVSWQESSEDITSLLKVRNTIMYSVVGAILVVASFGIYNVISTVVIEKTRDIAILKSMGFHARDILRIFVIEGMVIGLIGSIFGSVLGCGLIYALASVSLKVPGATDEVHLPVYWGFDQFVLAATFAMASAIFAAFLPARKGARLHPVDILRGAA